MLCRKVFQITGTVQGVGFRPCLCRLALAYGLKGQVANRNYGVHLVFEGDPATIDAAIAELRANPPRHAKISTINMLAEIKLEQAEMLDFRVEYDAGSELAAVTIPADLAMCQDCYDEILDSKNRRYAHPFATCVNCGPRYTVLRELPYERRNTSMAEFKMCSRCRAEYTNPADRRFHAETIACPDCGPCLTFADSAGSPVPSDDPLLTAAAVLQSGKIIALRGIGGFQLLADATNRETLAKLRQRKQRPDKPFALMAVEIAEVRRHCRTDAAGEQLLNSAAAPAVIFPVLPDDITLPLDLISPDTDTLGWMLPCTPLHLLLLRAAALPAVIATSGNRGGEPIALTNAEAVAALSGIADAFLFHDREIVLRNDDSVAAMIAGSPQLRRRARGYAPSPLLLPMATPPLLAFGADLKNCIAAAMGNEALISPHIGDLEHPAVFEFFTETINQLPRFLKMKPEKIAVDAHPDMFSTRYGENFAANAGIPLQRIQHHHAHAVSCLAEHGIPAGLALVFDGTGYGTDGTIWGAELLYADYHGFERLGTFAPAALPGGDNAVREPARQLLARIVQAGLSAETLTHCRPKLSAAKVAAWQQQVTAKINAPLSHAAGRLFDAVASMLGIAPERISYEGQAAIRLETAARRAVTAQQVLPQKCFSLSRQQGLTVIDWTPTFAASKHLLRLTPEQVTVAARDFHLQVADAAVAMVAAAIESNQHHGTKHLALSGGVFQNRLLVELLLPRLQMLGLNVLLHRELPPNDGGIAYGQAIIASTD